MRKRFAVSSPGCRVDSALSADRAVQTAAAIVFFLLVVCLALTTWQWRAARQAALAAQRQTQRTVGTRDFIAQLLRTAGNRSVDAAAQRPRMKDVLDGATPRIGREFVDDPRAQSELLGLVASMYREMGEQDSRRALLALQRIQLRRVYGAAHPVLIRSLLDEAQYEIARRDRDSANARLIEADILITQAGLDDDALRARWWMLHSDAQGDAAAGAAALDQAIAAFERQRPIDARLGEALARKAWRLLPTRPAQAEALFLRISVLPGGGATPASAANRRREALLGLARARESQGKYEAALEARDKARTMGANAPIAEAQFARALHREGRREPALAAFDALEPRLASTTAADVSDATVQAYYAECLAAEGRPTQAIALLEAAAVDPLGDGIGGPDSQRALLALGDAYDRAGLWLKARDTLKASLDRRLLHEPPDSAGVAEARERWGRFLLGQGDLDEAQAQFDLVLDQSDERNLERVVLAYGGLARVALARHDWDAALTASTHAVVGFENVVGARDVRSGPYVWLIHAEALRNVDDFASARIWATRALDASRRYDAPDAASIRDAQAVMSRLLG